MTIQTALHVQSSDGASTARSARFGQPINEGPGGGPKQQRCFKVLYVDDDPALGRLVPRFLGSYGHTIAVATDGITGLDAFRKDKPDVVLSDLDMPNMNGLEMARKILAESPGTKIIVFSGDLRAATMNEIMDAGVARFLAKPLSVGQLNDAINEVMGS